MSEQPVQPTPETSAPMAEVSAPAATPTTPVMQTPSPKSGGGKGLILIILVLLVVIAGGVGAFVVIQNNNNSQKSDSEMSKDKDEKSDEKKMAADEEKDEEERDASRENIEDLLGSITNEDDAMNQLDGFLDEVYKTVDLPSDFPSDAPVFDESGVFSVEEDETSFDIQMKYDPEEVSMDDVYEFYMEALEKEGWEIDTESKTSISFSITARKDDGEREIYVNGSEILDVFVSLDVTK